MLAASLATAAAAVCAMQVLEALISSGLVSAQIKAVQLSSAAVRGRHVPAACNSWQGRPEVDCS